MSLTAIWYSPPPNPHTFGGNKVSYKDLKIQFFSSVSVPHKTSELTYANTNVYLKKPRWSPIWLRFRWGRAAELLHTHFTHCLRLKIAGQCNLNRFSFCAEEFSPQYVNSLLSKPTTQKLDALKPNHPLHRIEDKHHYLTIITTNLCCLKLKIKPNTERNCSGLFHLWLFHTS